MGCGGCGASSIGGSPRARPSKHEARNPKFETNSNTRNLNVQNASPRARATAREKAESPVHAPSPVVLNLEHWAFGFVSCFEFRISNFLSRVGGAAKQVLQCLEFTLAPEADSQDRSRRDFESVPTPTTHQQEFFSLNQAFDCGSSPGGTLGNSPAIDRWDMQENAFQSPARGERTDGFFGDSSVPPGLIALCLPTHR